MSDFLLDPVERNSHLWRRLVEHIEAKRELYRRQNDNTTLDAVATAALRGRIQALNEILALDKPQDP